MEIIVGKYSGFCNGVKYTVRQTLKELEKNSDLFSLGDIIHNEIVINNLKMKGLIVKDSIDDIPNGSRVIIRAHGESVDTYSKAKEKKLDLIDLTCGKVKLIHTKILKNKDSSFIIIVGKKNHPETIAHKSYSKNSFIVESYDDIIESYNMFLKSGFKEIYIVAQTTFNELLFNQLVKEIKNVFKNVKITIDNTICNTTTLRQEETVYISKKVDIMIIVGGKNSSNTQELVNIARKYCNNVFWIQSVDDLSQDMFSKEDVIGIEAGASTSQKLIDEVIQFLNSIYKENKTIV